MNHDMDMCPGCLHMALFVHLEILESFIAGYQIGGLNNDSTGID